MKLLCAQKGQGALELVLLAAGILALSFFFLWLYLSSQETITAQLIAKNRLTEKLNSLEKPVIIEKIQPTVLPGQVLQLSIETIPRISIEELGDITDIAQEIVFHTSFVNVIIEFNPS